MRRLVTGGVWFLAVLVYLGGAGACWQWHITELTFYSDSASLGQKLQILALAVAWPVQLGEFLYLTAAWPRG